jgi:hypothetical protein
VAVSVIEPPTVGRVLLAASVHAGVPAERVARRSRDRCRARAAALGGHAEDDRLLRIAVAFGDVALGDHLRVHAVLSV